MERKLCNYCRRFKYCQFESSVYSSLANNDGTVESLISQEQYKSCPNYIEIVDKIPPIKKGSVIINLRAMREIKKNRSNK